VGARPTDWSVLKLRHDPTPGDPDGVDGIALYMEKVQHGAEFARAGLLQIVDQSGNGAFVGKTADWLRTQVTSQVTEFVGAVSQAFGTTAPAMRGYAQQMRQAQATADQALASAAGLKEDDPQLASLRGQAEGAGQDLATAAAAAKGKVEEAISYVRSPWAKSACEKFWEIFQWIVLVLTVGAIFVGGPLGLLAFALNAVMGIKGIVDFANGKIGVGGLFLSLLGMILPSTRALTLSSIKAIAFAGLDLLRKGAVAAAGLGGNAWRLIQSFSLSTVIKGVVDVAHLSARAIPAAALVVIRGVMSGDALLTRGFVVLKGFTLTAAHSVVNAARFGAQLGIRGTNLVGRGITGLGRVVSNELGGWKWLRIFTPLHGGEIGAVGVRGAFNIGVMTRGLLLPGRYGAELSLAKRIGATVTITDGIIRVGGATGRAVVGGFSTPGLHLPDPVGVGGWGRGPAVGALPDGGWARGGGALPDGGWARGGALPDAGWARGGALPDGAWARGGGPLPDAGWARGSVGGLMPDVGHFSTGSIGSIGDPRLTGAATPVPVSGIARAGEGWTFHRMVEISESFHSAGLGAGIARPTAGAVPDLLSVSRSALGDTPNLALAPGSVRLQGDLSAAAQSAQRAFKFQGDLPMTAPIEMKAAINEGFTVVGRTEDTVSLKIGAPESLLGRGEGPKLDAMAPPPSSVKHLSPGRLTAVDPVTLTPQAQLDNALNLLADPPAGAKVSDAGSARIAEPNMPGSKVPDGPGARIAEPNVPGSKVPDGASARFPEPNVPGSKVSDGASSRFPEPDLAGSRGVVDRPDLAGGPSTADANRGELGVLEGAGESPVVAGRKPPGGNGHDAGAVPALSSDDALRVRLTAEQRATENYADAVRQLTAAEAKLDRLMDPLQSSLLPHGIEFATAQKDILVARSVFDKAVAGLRDVSIDPAVADRELVKTAASAERW
jgi:hypothetical protein